MSTPGRNPRFTTLIKAPLLYSPENNIKDALIDAS